MSPRIVFLTDHGKHGRRLARVLIERGVALDAVLVATGSLIPLSQGLRSWAGALFDVARRGLRFYRHQRRFYAPLSSRVIAAGEINSAAMVAHLTRLSPDYILVGTGKILHSPLIETARCGVLNAHPGLLPWMRGSGIPGHSLQQNVPLGATLHYIDAGIDTGALIERRLLPTFAPDAKLYELEEATGELGAALLADVALRIARGGEKPIGTPQTARFPLFRWTDLDGRRPQNALARAGRARQLFEAWQSLSNGAPDYVLPPDWMDAPFDPKP